MPVYHCKCCDYETHIKTHYTKHMKTKKHLNCIQNVSTIENSSKDKGIIVNIINKSYKYSQGLSKHIKYTRKIKMKI